MLDSGPFVCLLRCSGSFLSGLFSLKILLSVLVVFSYLKNSSGEIRSLPAGNTAFFSGHAPEMIMAPIVC